MGFADDVRRLLPSGFADPLRVADALLWLLDVNERGQSLRDDLAPGLRVLVELHPEFAEAVDDLLKLDTARELATEELFAGVIGCPRDEALTRAKEWALRMGETGLVGHPEERPA